METEWYCAFPQIRDCDEPGSGTSTAQRSWRSLRAYGEPHRHSGVPLGADVPGDQPDRGGGLADTVPSGGPEDDAGHHDCES
jgi:hypothetical protein